MDDNMKENDIPRKPVSARNGKSDHVLELWKHVKASEPKFEEVR